MGGGTVPPRRPAPRSDGATVAVAAALATAAAPAGAGAGAGAAPLVDRTAVELTTSASMPGRITGKGNSILGSAAFSGVRSAAVIEFAAMARCTTRKSVHQQPNDSTNPSPITRPNHSTPTAIADACPINAQLRVDAPAAQPLS